MSCKVVRNSKFRHVFGQAAKKQDCYDNIRITKSSWDSTFCCANPKFLAIITEAAGGGAFLVLPIEKVGRIDRDIPLVDGHKAPVLDIAWCPHNDNLIASSSEDCTVKIWDIPNGGLNKNLTECAADLIAHQRRVGSVSWHPSANLILLTAGSDFKIFVWNVGTAEILTEIDCHQDIIYSIAWNYNGSRIVTTCKDKNIRVIDARSGKVLRLGKGHQAVKPMRAIYMKDNRIFTTGYSRTGERQYALWDQEKLNQPLVIQEVDSSNGVLFPFYDEDTNMIYLCGKGDSTIRYFEYTNESPYIHYLNTYSSSDPQRGMGFMSKRGLNVGQCEIAKYIFKLHNSGLCEVIVMTVPRKSELFQEDLYPDTAAEQAAITGEEWFNGKNANPILISLKESFLAAMKDAKNSAGGSILRQPSKRLFDKFNQEMLNSQASIASRSIIEPTPTRKISNNEITSLQNNSRSNPSIASQSVTSVQPTENEMFQKIQEEIKRLKIIVKGHEKRIKTLEDKLVEYNIDYDDD